MKTAFKFILLSLVVTISLWGQGQGSQPVSLLSGSAIISDMKGEVFITLAAQAAANGAQKGQLLAPNTTIECKKGSALLTLSDGSQVLVKSNTRVILRAPEQSKGSFLDQLIGKITATVKKRTAGEPSFRMGTPTAVITVRGTKFNVEVSKHEQTFVQVFEGLVEVDGVGSMGHPVYVQPGYVTQVSVNIPPEIPHKIFEDGERGSSSATPRSRKEGDSEGRSGRQPSGDTGTGGTGSEVDD